MSDPATPPVAGQIVVAGSVGKASTGAIIAALLQSAGLHAVQFDSRYLHSALERLRIDGQPLDAATAREILSRSPAGQEPDPFATLLRGCVERLDAPWLVLSGTAPLPGAVAEIVFAPIVPDGGGSAADVATALTGRMAPAPVAVSGLQRESALDVLRAHYPDLVEVAANCRLARGQATLDGQEFRLRTGSADYRFHLPLLGAYQAENAATAVLAVEQLAPLGVELDAAQAREALDALRLPGRMEVIKRRPLVIVDCNAVSQAFRRTADAVRELSAGRRLSVVLDLSAGLDPPAAVPALAPMTDQIVASGPPAALAAYREACLAAELSLQTAAGLTAAIEQAVDAAGERDAVAVLGSAAAAGAARAAILGLLPADDPLH